MYTKKAELKEFLTDLEIQKSLQNLHGPAKPLMVKEKNKSLVKTHLTKWKSSGSN